MSKFSDDTHGTRRYKLASEHIVRHDSQEAECLSSLFIVGILFLLVLGFVWNSEFRSGQSLNYAFTFDVSYDTRMISIGEF